jgi:hypothetical protein
MRTLLVSSLLLAACGSKDKPAAEPPAPAKPFALTGLKLMIDLPGNATLDTSTDAYADATWPGVHMGVRTNRSGLNSSTLDRAVSGAGDVKVTKKALTADGWDLRYEETLGGEPLFDVVIHRVLAEVELECHGSSPTQQGADAIAAACATLRPS